MKPVLLDTGAIVALLDRKERYHARCKEAVNSANGPLVTCEAVIAEACYLMRKIPRAVDAILSNVAQGVFLIPFDVADHVGRIRSLLKRYNNLPMDYADACLVCLAEQFETDTILTLDSDFKIYRWNTSRSFNLAIDLRTRP
jgi:predicted nucleic acid-binding protein